MRNMFTTRFFHIRYYVKSRLEYVPYWGLIINKCIRSVEYLNVSVQRST